MAADRRRALGAFVALPLAACTTRLRTPERGPIEAIALGSLDDSGANAAAVRGLREIESRFAMRTRITAVDASTARATAEELARAAPGMIVAIGARLSAPIQAVAWSHPQERFTVIDGDPAHLRPNLAIYAARQAESAWLAGAAAGLIGHSGVVGHIGGARASAALAARAAFAAGLAATNARARVASTFTGNDDDAEAAARAARAQIVGRADLIFTTLGPARTGVSEVCRASGIRQIGSGADWVAVDPAVFAAAAVADAGEVIVAAVDALRDSIWRGDEVRTFGLRHAPIVRLALAPDIPQTTRAALAGLRADVVAGRIAIPTEFRGTESAA